MITEYPVTLKNFIHWVARKDPNEIIGRSQIFDYCPIANALKDKVEDKYIRVRGDITFVGYDMVINPKWVKEFISEIDKLGFQKSITTRQTLEVLSQIV